MLKTLVKFFQVWENQEWIGWKATEGQQFPQIGGKCDSTNSDPEKIFSLMWL